MGMCSQVEVGGLRTKLCRPSPHFSALTSHTGFPVANDAYPILWQCGSDKFPLSPTPYINPVSPDPRRSAISKARQTCKPPEQGSQAWSTQTVL